MAKIIYWEDVQTGQPYSLFLANRRSKKGLSPSLPTMSVNAHINHGRWVVSCPGGCGDDVLASNTVKEFTCSMPACPATDVYEVIFPLNHNAIETELLTRPAHPSGALIHANWLPTETLASLKKETELNMASESI